jgi:hypothetical protein
MMMMRIAGALFSLLMSTVVVGGCTLLCCCLCYDTLYYGLVCCSVFNRDLRGSSNAASHVDGVKKHGGDDGFSFIQASRDFEFQMFKEKSEAGLHCCARHNVKCRRRADENPSTAPLNSNPALIITLSFFRRDGCPLFAALLLRQRVHHHKMTSVDINRSSLLLLLLLSIESALCACPASICTLIFSCSAHAISVAA